MLLARAFVFINIMSKLNSNNIICLVCVADYATDGLQYCYGYTKGNLFYSSPIHLLAFFKFL